MLVMSYSIGLHSSKQEKELLIHRNDNKVFSDSRSWCKRGNWVSVWWDFLAPWHFLSLTFHLSPDKMNSGLHFPDLMIMNSRTYICLENRNQFRFRSKKMLLAKLRERLLHLVKPWPVRPITDQLFFPYLQYTERNSRVPRWLSHWALLI